MFSTRQKQEIAKAVEDVILSFEHPEMPKEKPLFKVRVEGKEPWSWAEILPNWIYNESNPPSVNPHNELMDNKQYKNRKDGHPTGFTT